MCQVVQIKRSTDYDERRLKNNCLKLYHSWGFAATVQTGINITKFCRRFVIKSFLTGAESGNSRKFLMTIKNLLKKICHVCCKKMRLKSFFVVSITIIGWTMFIFFSLKQDLIANNQRSETANTLRPAFLSSKGKTDALIVLGLATVNRQNETYLYRTLESLTVNMNWAEQNETLIVVFIGETDINYVQHIASEIKVRFSKYCEMGIIDVVSPEASCYPDLDNLRITLDDSKDRVRWRSKQNLEIAFLMEYSQSKSKYFLLLEDDIQTKPGYLTVIKEFIQTCDNRPAPFDRYPWYLLDFCKLGSIGKLVRSADLPDLISFFRIFFNDKPLDWLIDYFLITKFCHYEHDKETCRTEKDKIWLRRSPSVFQHIGKISSLYGKIQNLKDDEFVLD